MEEGDAVCSDADGAGRRRRDEGTIFALPLLTAAACVLRLLQKLFTLPTIATCVPNHLARSPLAVRPMCPSRCGGIRPLFVAGTFAAASGRMTSAGACQLHESAVAGYKYNGSKLWRTSRLGGVSMATALRALIKCDFSVRAACHEIGGDHPLAPDLKEFLLSATVVVDGQQISRFEVRDKEVLEAEVLEELVCTLVQDVRHFREQS